MAMRYTVFRLFILAAAATTAGCAPTWRDCKLYTFDDYKVMACDDGWAKEYCRGKCKTADDGRQVDYYPRACAVNMNRAKGNPSVVIGRSYMDCLPHEICHIEGKLSAKECAAKFPCANDTK